MGITMHLDVYVLRLAEPNMTFQVEWGHQVRGICKLSNCQQKII